MTFYFTYTRRWSRESDL